MPNMHDHGSVPSSVQQACESTIFNWAQAQDTKDRARLLSAFAPIITTDYTDVGIPLQTNIPAQQQVDIILGPNVLGPEDIRTQHLIGAQSWSRISDRRVRCDYQIRAAQLRVTSTNSGPPPGVDGPKAIAQGWNRMEFEPVEGKWRIVYLAIHVTWTDGDWNEVFTKIASSGQTVKSRL